MENQVERIDLNTATLEALQSLPRVSLKIAQRIEAARPFASIDDLEHIQGMRSKTREALRPLVTVISQESAVVEAGEMPIISTPAAILLEPEREAVQVKDEIASLETAPEDIEENWAVEAALQVRPVDAIPEETPVEVFQPVSEKAPESVSQAVQAPTQPQKAGEAPAVVSETAPRKYVTRGNLFWSSAAAASFAVILAILVTLGVLGLVNGGLRFVRPDQLNAVAVQLDRMDNTVGVIQEDLLALQTRLEAVEGLAAQVSRLEETMTATVDQVSELETQIKDITVVVNDLSSQTDSLTTQVGDLALQADELRQDVDNLSSQVDGLINRTNVFQKFFDGLKDLVKLFDKP